jgi:hypothetical protein
MARPIPPVGKQRGQPMRCFGLVLFGGEGRRVLRNGRGPWARLGATGASMSLGRKEQIFGEGQQTSARARSDKDVRHNHVGLIIVMNRAFPILVVAAIVTLPLYMMTEKPLIWLALTGVAFLALCFWRTSLTILTAIVIGFFWWSHGRERAKAECTYEVAKLLPMQSGGGIADVYKQQLLISQCMDARGYNGGFDPFFWGWLSLGIVPQ